MPEFLPCAFYRAHDKERICRVSARKHTATMLFAVCQALAHGDRGVSSCVNPQAHGEHRSRGSHADSAVRGLTAVIVCHVPESGTRRTQIFAVCHMAGTRRNGSPVTRHQGRFYLRVSREAHNKDYVCRVPQSSTRRTRKKIMFLLPNFFYTLHILFGTLCLNMIFL